MKTSLKGVRALMKSEAFRPDAYQDSVGIWTIGYGTTRLNGKPVVKGMRITQDDAQVALQDYLGTLEGIIAKTLGDSCMAKTSQNEFDAFVNIGYNIGHTALTGSTFIKRHIAGNHSGCAEAMSWWNKAGGKTVQGLVNRRQREMNMYLNGVYVM